MLVSVTCEALGWCSWLSRAPHTREVTSSILVSSTFLLSRVCVVCGARMLVEKCPGSHCSCDPIDPIGTAIPRGRDRETFPRSVVTRCSGGVVGYHASLTRWRSRVRLSARIFLLIISSSVVSSEDPTNEKRTGREVSSTFLFSIRSRVCVVCVCTVVWVGRKVYWFALQL